VAKGILNWSEKKYWKEYKMANIKDELEKVIEKADKGLYSAKASGKNKVVVL
jgi:hypothetical protein